MTTESYQKLCEAVRKFFVFYDKEDKYFKDKNKEKLARADVVKKADYGNGK